MARLPFAGTANDYTFSTYTLGSQKLVALTGATLTFYDAETGGNQVTDLTDASGAAISSVTVPADGGIPRFYGPDGVTELWASANGSTTRTLVTVSMADQLKADYVPVQRTVNGKALSGDVTLTPADVGAQDATTLDADVTTKINDSTSQTHQALSAAIAVGGRAPAIRPDRTLPALPVGTNCWATGSTYATASNSGTCKTPHYAAQDCTDIRLVYAHHAPANGMDHDVAGTVTARASVEINNVLYRITFRGRTDATLDPGAIITSDPLAVDLPAGTKFYVRTYYSSTQPITATTVSYGASGTGGFVNGQDFTDPESAPVLLDGASKYLWGPRAILGTPVARDKPTVLIVGDSISVGYKDGPSNGGDLSAFAADGTLAGGYICRGLGNNVGWINVGRAGELGRDFAKTSYSFRRNAYANGVTHAIVEYGRNDLDSNRSLAQIQADLQTIWNRLAERGVKVFQTTVTPETTSSDSWATTTNQTVVGSESIRTALNDWIRTTPAPLAGYFEAADLAETARNSGIWKAGYTGDGIHPNATGAAAVAACIDTSRLVVASPANAPLSTPAPAASTIYASDGFDRADGPIGSTPIGGFAWTVLNGTQTDWTVAGNHARYTVNTTGVEGRLAVDTGQSDGRITATIVTASNAGHDSGIIFRATDSQNYWMVWTNPGGNYKLMKMVANAYATVNSDLGVAAAAGDVVRVELAGSSISVYINGVRRATATDTFNQAATKHGLRVSSSVAANTIDFDNFTHQSIPA